MEIERKVSEFQSELQRILLTRNIDQFFTDQEASRNTKRNLEVLFSKNSDLILSIHLFDVNQNVFVLVKDKNNGLLTDQYKTRIQKQILTSEHFHSSNGDWAYQIPYFSDNKVLLNILIVLDINNFVHSEFENYRINNTQWQALLNADGSIELHNHSATEIELSQIDDINTALSKGFDGSILQWIILDKTKEKFITSYYPVNIFKENLGVLFSISTERILTTVLLNIISLAAATFLIFIVILLIFLSFLKRKQQEEIKLKKSENRFRIILESLPIGILSVNPDKKILTANKAALEILNIQDAKIILGKDSKSLFFHFKDLPLSIKNAREKTNLFVYYDENDNEIFLFKKEIPLESEGENISLLSFIDVTLLENARKAEVAANAAKSDFINKISQDIRTPLNGILSMSEALYQVKNLDEDKKDKIEVIGKSAELLLSVINDLIDFSKTEISNILVEDTPFSLKSEIEIVIASFISLYKDKDFNIFTEFDENLPEDIIGDPFIIRQILTNLLGYSLKNSRCQKVLISSRLAETDKEQLTLEITIQDNGEGLTEDTIRLFNLSPAFDQSSNFQGIESLLKSKKLTELISGKLSIESPSQISNENNPGIKFTFTFKAFSTVSSGKNIDFNHIKTYQDIKVLIFHDPKKKDKSLQKILKELEIKSDSTDYNESSISLLKAKLAAKEDNYSMIVICDTPSQNAFSIARDLFIHNLSEKYLIMMISSNNRSGNLVKSMRMAVDSYLLFPYESSEIFDFIQNHFPQIEIPKKRPIRLKKLREDISILVAEDNTVNQKVAQIIFKNLGFEIDIAINGQKAVEMVREKNYDIIFMDIKMPLKTGIDATYELRKLGYTLPIIALTANVTQIDKSRALEVGMNDFLGKPVRVENIKNILIKWFSVPV